MRLRLEAAASAAPPEWWWWEEDGWPDAAVCAEDLDLVAAGVTGEE